MVIDCGIPMVLPLCNTSDMEQPPSINCGVGQGHYVQEPLGSVLFHLGMISSQTRQTARYSK